MCVYLLELKIPHSISKMAPTFITISFSHTPPPFTPSPPPHLFHLLYLALLLFHKWPLLFSASLSHFSVPFFLCSLLLVAHHSKLSRVGNYYPQSQALNQRIFYTFYNASSLSPAFSSSWPFHSLSNPPQPPPVFFSLAWGLVIPASLNTAVAVNPIY